MQRPLREYVITDDIIANLLVLNGSHMQAAANVAMPGYKLKHMSCLTGSRSVLFLLTMKDL